MTLAGTIYVLWLLPDALLRFGLWLLTRTFYRVRVLGRDHIPGQGGALFVCNHVSFVDALLLIASTDRPVRFHDVRRLLRTALGEAVRAHPRRHSHLLGAAPARHAQSLQTASEAIRAGDVVCIFAEGQITRIGQLLPFRRGLEKIMKDVEAPIVPVALDGVWGSIFSFEKRRFLWKWPRHFPYPVTVSFGAPMPPRATAVRGAPGGAGIAGVGVVLSPRSADAAAAARVCAARRGGIRSALRWPTRSRPKVSFGSALVKTIFLARRLKTVWAGQEKVGLLLPPSVPGALVNFAAMLLGKVPVNLNYTLSEQALASCIRQCDIKTVVTSKVFLEKVKLDAARANWFSSRNARRGPASGEKLAAFFMAWLLPAGWLERALGRGRKSALDDLATVIFSSGSTGEPKGVMLSHYNIGSNIEQMEQVFSLDRQDRFPGRAAVFPFVRFHRHALSAGGAGRGRGLSRQSA